VSEGASSVSEGASTVEAPGGAPEQITTLARGTVVNLAGILVNGISQLALVVVVGRVLGPRDGGILFVAIAFFTISFTAIKLGADTGLLRFAPTYVALGDREALWSVARAAIWPVLALSVILGALTFAFAAPLARVFFTHSGIPGDDGTFLRVLAPFIPMAAVTAVLLAGTRALGTMVPFVLVEQVGKPVARPVLVVLAHAVGFGMAGVIAAWAAPTAVGVAVALFLFLAQLRRAAGPRSHDGLPGDTVRRFWQFSAPRGISAFFNIALIWLDVILVGSLRSASDAGIYGATSRFVIMGTFAVQAVGLTIGPQISSLLAQRRIREAETVYQVATWWMMLLSWPVYILLAVFPGIFLGVFGPQFNAGATALVILSLATLLNMGTGNCQVVLLMAGKSSWHLANTLAAVVANLVINLLFTPRYGIDAAAVAWAISIAIDNLAGVIEVWILLGIEPFGLQYTRLAIVSAGLYAGAGLAARALFGHTTASLGIAFAVATALFGAFLWRSRTRLRLDVLIGALRRRPVAKEQLDAVL
jgi:O-antigen/teichoic acid export membrane protein